MHLGDEALGGKLSLKNVAFVSGICTQLKGPHLSIFFSQCGNRSEQSETWKVLPRAIVYWVALTLDFRLPGPRGLPSSSELFLVNVGQVPVSLTSPPSPGLHTLFTAHNTQGRS